MLCSRLAGQYVKVLFCSKQNTRQCELRTSSTQMRNPPGASVAKETTLHVVLLLLLLTTQVRMFENLQ